jgi:hypothetical protein
MTHPPLSGLLFRMDQQWSFVSIRFSELEPLCCENITTIWEIEPVKLSTSGRIRVGSMVEVSVENIPKPIE